LIEHGVIVGAATGRVAHDSKKDAERAVIMTPSFSLFAKLFRPSISLPPTLIEKRPSEPKPKKPAPKLPRRYLNG